MAGFFKGLYCFSRCRWWLTLHFICGSSFFLTDLLLFSHIFPIALLQTFYSVQWSGAAPPLTATNTTNTTNNNTDNKNSHPILRRLRPARRPRLPAHPLPPGQAATVTLQERQLQLRPLRRRGLRRKQRRQRRRQPERRHLTTFKQENI